MFLTQISELKIPGTQGPEGGGDLTPVQYEATVAGSLVADLDQQLTTISQRLRGKLEERQALRAQIEALESLKITVPVLEIEGHRYVDLSPDQTQILQLSPAAEPQYSETGALTGYRVKEEDFQQAIRTNRESLDERLAGLNSNGELTMIQIQSLVDQRKQALTLLSNLISAMGEVAKTIIGNTRT